MASQASPVLAAFKSLKEAYEEASRPEEIARNAFGICRRRVRESTDMDEVEN